MLQFGGFVLLLKKSKSKSSLLIYVMRMKKFGFLPRLTNFEATVEDWDA